MIERAAALAYAILAIVGLFILAVYTETPVAACFALLCAGASYAAQNALNMVMDYELQQRASPTVLTVFTLVCWAASVGSWAFGLFAVAVKLEGLI